METRQVNVLTIIAEGARARTLGRPKDACPYPAASPERTAWMEGYDGTPVEDGPDSPMTDA
jgi:hypothetical protein